MTMLSHVPPSLLLVFFLLPVSTASESRATFFQAPLKWTPAWPPTYNMSMSTIVMPCNYSGWTDPAWGAQWGIIDFDWSNAKALWANAQPMDCEERLVEQARRVKAINPNTKVFVYRNLVKALPWYTNVREKLTDPAYAGWFLAFKPGGSLPNHTYHVPPCTAGKCSALYHDQEQTPEHPGVCVQPCDCGSVPCGEYLWDHRNESLRDYLLSEVVLGKNGLGSPYVDGFFFDDGWSDHQQPILPWMPPEGFCDHNSYGGPSEENVHCVEDMGLGVEDVVRITAAWRATMQAVLAAVQAHGAFSWPQFEFINTPGKQWCGSWMRQACAGKYANSTIMHQLTLNPNGDPFPLPAFTQDLATFLLLRGPYAWLGYSWLGCSSGGEPPGGGAPPAHGPFARPPGMDADYGEPLEVGCREVSEGVFERAWSKARVRMDCNTWEGSVEMK